VVQKRRAAGEALDAEKLLGVERAVGRPVLRVALGRDVATPDVEHARSRGYSFDMLSLATDQRRPVPTRPAEV